MKDENCIFCKLANGDIPTATVYEDEDFRVILDANPAAKGHALILPKEHYANLYEIDDELAGKSMILAKKMITKLTKALGCDGYNIVQNNGEAAGQTVFHYHVHMIPRHKDDKVGLGWTMHELTEEEKEEPDRLPRGGGRDGCVRRGGCRAGDCRAAAHARQSLFVAEAGSGDHLCRFDG